MRQTRFLLAAIPLCLIAAASAADETETVARHLAVFDRPPQRVPTRGMPDGPLLGNGDVGVVLAGPPEAQSFYIGKNDFWTSTPARAKVINVGCIELQIPALAGASYRQEQDLARAEVRGMFTKDAVTVRTRSWVQAERNLLLYYGGGGIENCGGFVAVNEMLLQSHEGALKLFPCWPKDQDARFGKLRAVGAFLVSAELRGGVVAGVEIRSEKGRECTVVNPWPNQDVQLLRNDRKPQAVHGTRFAFATQPGETIRLKPAAGDSQRQPASPGTRQLHPSR